MDLGIFCYVLPSKTAFSIFHACILFHFLVLGHAQATVSTHPPAAEDREHTYSYLFWLRLDLSRSAMSIVLLDIRGTHQAVQRDCRVGFRCGWFPLLAPSSLLPPPPASLPPPFVPSSPALVLLAACLPSSAFLPSRPPFSSLLPRPAPRPLPFPRAPSCLRSLLSSPSLLSSGSR